MGTSVRLAAALVWWMPSGPSGPSILPRRIDLLGSPVRSEMTEQIPCAAQIPRVETLVEAAVEIPEEPDRLVGRQPLRPAKDGSELQRPGVLASRNADRLPETGRCLLGETR
jgi:hypothetical protein